MSPPPLTDEEQKMLQGIFGAELGQQFQKMFEDAKDRNDESKRTADARHSAVMGMLERIDGRLSTVETKLIDKLLEKIK